MTSNDRGSKGHIESPGGYLGYIGIIHDYHTTQLYGEYFTIIRIPIKQPPTSIDLCLNKPWDRIFEQMKPPSIGIHGCWGGSEKFETSVVYREGYWILREFLDVPGS